MNAQQVNVDACLQALSGWGLVDLWMVLAKDELWELAEMLADYTDGEPTLAHTNPEAAQRLGWMVQSCGLDPATGERLEVEA